MYFGTKNENHFVYQTICKSLERLSEKRIDEIISSGGNVDNAIEKVMEVLKDEKAMKKMFKEEIL